MTELQLGMGGMRNDQWQTTTGRDATGNESRADSQSALGDRFGVELVAWSLPVRMVSLRPRERWGGGTARSLLESLD